ncbi:hypothetical protein DVH05_028667 [Phytophthora capsici]|nr:hypothetical protein DVH05_028667 [Phytophthora capsici]
MELPSPPQRRELTDIERDKAIVSLLQRLGLDVELCCQLPNSPDLNRLDLGLFTAIQARQRQRTSRSIDELVDAVSAAYWELPPSTINATFLSLQGSMDLCIKNTGGNALSPPHIAKAGGKTACEHSMLTQNSRNCVAPFHRAAIPS